MQNSRLVAVLALLLPAIAFAEIADTATEKRLSLLAPSPVLSFPKDDWALEQQQRRPGDTAVYYMFSSKARGANFSVYLDRTDDCLNAADCLDVAMRNPAYKAAKDVQRFASGNFRALSFFIDRSDSLPVQQAHVIASAYSGGVWIDIHISKMGDKRPEIAPLRELLKQMTLTAPLTEAAPGGELRVPLKNRGEIAMQLPAGWVERSARTDDEVPPTIRLGSAAGSAFVVLITPIWPAKPDALPPNNAEIRRLVEDTAQSVKSQAVERELPLREIRGAAASGYYFAATDPKPEKGGYKYMTQGAMGLADLRVTFTILTNDKSGIIANKALDVLKSLRRVN